MADIRHYRVRLIPDAHKTAINRLIAMIVGEDIMASQNLSQPASADGQLPASHWYGGAFGSLQDIGIWQSLATNLPEPEGGWPLMVGEEVVLTEEDAQAAADVLDVEVRTGPWTSQMPQQTLAACLAANNLQKVVIEEV
jgi:hypothetical protein